MVWILDHLSSTLHDKRHQLSALELVCDSSTVSNKGGKIADVMNYGRKTIVNAALPLTDATIEPTHLTR